MRRVLSGVVIAAGLAVFPPGSASPPGAGELPVRRTDAIGDPLPEGAVARLGTARLCQPSVNYLAFAADGLKLATLSEEGVLQVWEVKSGKALRAWTVARAGGYDSNTGPLVFSPDGRRLALAGRGNDRTVRVWDVESGKEVLAIPMAKGPEPSRALCYSPNGKLLATVEEQNVFVFDSRSGEVVRQFGADYRYPSHLAFAADGKTLTAVGHDGVRRLSFHFWEVASGRETGKHSAEYSTNWGSLLSPDGRFLAVRTADLSAFKLIDVPMGKELALAGQANSAYSSVFAGNGSTLLAGGWDGQIRVWEAATGKFLYRFGAHAGPVKRVALSADGKTAAVATGGDDAVHVWDVSQQKELHAFAGHRNGPVSVSFSPDGKSVYVADWDAEASSPPHRGDGWTIRRWNTPFDREEVVGRHRPDTYIRFNAFSPDGRWYAVADHSARLRVYETSTGKEAGQWQLPTTTFTVRRGDQPVERREVLSASDLTFSSDGAQLAVAGSGHITLYDRATGKRIKAITHPRPENLRCRFMRDGSLVIAEVGSFRPQAVTQVDVRTGTLIRQFAGDPDGPWALATVPSGRGVAVVTGRQVPVYEARTGKVRCLAKVEGYPTGLAFSPNGRLLVIPARDATARMVDAITGREMARLGGHSGPVSSVAFSPDGRLLATGGWNTALIWDVPAFLRRHDPDPPEPNAEELVTLWDQLGDADPPKAAPALARLSRGGERTIRFLRDRLSQPPPASADQVERWVAELESDRFAVRERAARELARLGGLAERALKKAQAGSPAADAAERIKKLLAAIEGVPPTVLRTVRGLEVLEMVGDRAARVALESLAKEAFDPFVREEAAAAVRRLSPRP